MAAAPKDLKAKFEAAAAAAKQTKRKPDNTTLLKLYSFYKQATEGDVEGDRPGGFDFVFDGVGEDSYRRSFAALKPGGLLCAYGYSAGVQAQRRLLATLTWIARVYLWRRLLSWLLGGKRVSIFSINLMRARHPAWFKQDLEQLFGLLAAGAIRPRIAKRISFDEVAEAHRRLEAGSLDGRLVLCPNFPSDQSG